MDKFRYGIVLLLLTGGVLPLFGGDIAGKVTTTGARGNTPVIVFVEDVGQEFSPADTPAVMNQKNLTFVPHVLPILVGSTVQFRNSDDVLHNVFTPDKCGGKINLGTWPKGESREYTFQEGGCISVMLCNVHPEMEAWILVLQNPFYTQVDAQGSYLIKDVPPGEYRVTAWHERLKNRTEVVSVGESKVTEIDFSLSRR